MPIDNNKREKRLIMIKIFVERNRVLFDQVSFKNEMLELDEKFKGKLEKDQGESRRNKASRNDPKIILQPGARVQADDYVAEPEYSHPGIHLFTDAKDEIVWFSEQQIRFTVDIQRDKELVRLTKETR